MNKRKTLYSIINATFIVLIVAATIGITWGIPQLTSFGEPNFPKIGLDDKIPFVSEFVWVYFLTFPLGIATIYILYFKNRQRMYDVVLTIIICFYISMIFYYVYPVEMLKPEISGNSFTELWTQWTYDSCRAVNCFPSQHCFMALACIFASLYEKNTHWLWRIFTAVMGVLIILSTMFLKQHYFLDFVASFCIMVPIFIIVRLFNAGDAIHNAIERKRVNIATKKQQKMK